MTPTMAGLVGLVALFALLAVRMPIGLAMMLVGAAGIAVLNSPAAAMNVLGQFPYSYSAVFTLSVIPLFVLMGSFAGVSGMGTDLYRTAYTWIGHRRGGLAAATILACAGFAALSGSSIAAAATMGKVALPEMKRYGYDDTLATGAVAAAGTLGILIPPSTVFIVYAILTEESIGKLFIAGIVPGALLSLLFVATVALLCARNPKLGPPGPATTLAQKMKATRGIVEAVVLFVLAIGGLMLGWFSPTQAGAIGAGGALAIGLARRKLSWKSFVDAGREGLGTSCMVLFIIAGAIVFGHFMAVSKIPFALADWVGELPLQRTAIMALIVVIYFIGGFFMDSMALIVVTLPIFYPVVRKLGFDPIWFGVMIVLLCEMGVITPPVGVNVFVIKSIVPDVPLQRIFRGIFPFLGAIVLLAGFIVFVPGIATFLPGLVK